jgi:hypothetical protein
MGLFGKLLGNDKISLLKTEITVDEGMNYNVAFTKLHPELKSPEFIRLTLHYYAKILFNFGGTDPQSAQSSDILLNLMNHLCSSTTERTSNILHIVDIDDVVSISYPNNNGLRKIEATLNFLDPMTRQIVTKIPMKIYNQQVVYSVFVLLNEVQKHLDEIQLSMLFDKLRTLTSIYMNGEDFSSMRNLSLLPNKVFFG